MNYFLAFPLALCWCVRHTSLEKKRCRWLCAVLYPKLILLWDCRPCFPLCLLPGSFVLPWNLWVRLEIEVLKGWPASSESLCTWKRLQTPTTILLNRIFQLWGLESIFPLFPAPSLMFSLIWNPPNTVVPCPLFSLYKHPG